VLNCPNMRIILILLTIVGMQSLQAASISVDYTFSRFGYDTAVYDLQNGYLSGTAYGGGSYGTFLMAVNQANPQNPVFITAQRSSIQVSNYGQSYVENGNAGFYMNNQGVQSFVEIPYYNVVTHGFNDKYVVGAVGNSGLYEKGMIYNRLNNTTSYISINGYNQLNVTGVSGNKIIGWAWNGGIINGYTPDYRGFWSEIGSDTYNWIDLPNGGYIIPEDIDGSRIVGNFIQSFGSNYLNKSFYYDISNNDLTYFSVYGDQTQLTGIDGDKLAGSYYSSGTRRGFVATVIPEPSALSLLAVGLGGLAMMRRRRS